PKPLVPVAGRTLLDRVLDRLVEGGITRAVVNVHYLGEQIIDAVATRDAPAITISDERDGLLDTGGGVAKALPLIGDAAFFVQNSDSIWIEGPENNIARMRRYWDAERMEGMLLLAMTTTSTGYAGRGDFAMDANGLLSRRPETGVVPFVFAGVSIMHPRLFANAPADAFSLNALWDQAIASERLYGLRLEGKWMHVGSPLGLAEAETALSEADRA
ncbi:MAG: nucleotidyltransferase family protein, partial [Hyphomicrobiaceae bacterium]